MGELTPIECEARLVGLSKQRRKDGDWVEVKFHIHPDDHPAALFILPLGTQCMLGVKGVPEKPDETTTAEERPKGTEGWSEAKRKMVQRSGIVRNEPAFHRFLESVNPVVWGWARAKSPDDVQAAAYCIHQWCTVESCRDLEPGAFTGDRFLELMRDYEASQQGRTDDAYQAMARDGRT